MAGVQIYGNELVTLQVKRQTRMFVVLKDAHTTKLFAAHPLVETFNRKNGTNLRVIPYDLADAALNFGETWRSLSGIGFPVDASIAYEEPGIKLGAQIVYFARDGSEVVLATGKYKGEKNVGLATLGVSSKDFKPDGKSTVLDISEDRLILVKNFPDLDGWYMPHKQTGIPHGKRVDNSNPRDFKFNARYLSRLNDSPYVGLLVGYVGFGGAGQCVHADHDPSGSLGVVAEVPDADVAKINGILHSEAPLGHLCGILKGYTPSGTD